MAGDRQTRSNEEWLEQLRSEGSTGSAAGDLRRYLGGGLYKALGGAEVGPDDIDDFAQDAVIKVLGSLDTFRGDSRFTTWAMAVATRTAYSALRTRRYRARRELSDPASLEHALETAEAPEDRGEELVQRADLVTALRRSIMTTLTERQRRAILGELAGVPSTELADDLGISRNALYKLHHDARKKLKAALYESGFTQEDVRESFAKATKA